MTITIVDTLPAEIVRGRGGGVAVRAGDRDAVV